MCRQAPCMTCSRSNNTQLHVEDSVLCWPHSRTACLLRFCAFFKSCLYSKPFMARRLDATWQCVGGVHDLAIMVVLPATWSPGASEAFQTLDLGFILRLQGCHLEKQCMLAEMPTKVSVNMLYFDPKMICHAISNFWSSCDSIGWISAELRYAAGTCWACACICVQQDKAAGFV